MSILDGKREPPQAAPKSDFAAAFTAIASALQQNAENSARLAQLLEDRIERRPVDISPESMTQLNERFAGLAAAVMELSRELVTLRQAQAAKVLPIGARVRLATVEVERSADGNHSVVQERANG